MKNIILLAPPAAGKGTLAKELEKNLGYIPLSTGDMLREKAKSDDDLASLMKTGMLIDDKTVFEAVKFAIEKMDKPYILDGFPRTLEQAKMYDSLLTSLNRDLGVVIYLDVSYDVLLDRATSRRICPNCKRSYNTLNKDLMSRIDGICDDCNMELIIRSDDTVETFNSRYDEYLEKTSPLVDYYKEKGNLYIVSALDAHKTYDEVTQIIK